MVGMILGIIALFAWTIPIIGFPISIPGLILSIRGLKKEPRNKGMCIAGIVMNIIGLVASIINSSIGAYMGYKGLL